MTDKEIIKNNTLETAGESSTAAQQNLSLTKRINTLLELVPSKESLSGEEQVRDYFYQQEYDEYILKEGEKFIEREKIKEKWENGKLELISEKKNYWKTLNKETLKNLSRYQILKEKRMNELGENVAKKAAVIVQAMFNPFSLLLSNEPSKESKELENVKKLALTEGSNQGEVKNFVNVVSQELTLIKMELEKREKEKEKELWGKQEEINKLEEIISNGKKKILEEEKKNEEQKKKLLESQNQLYSSDKSNFEELKEKHRKLELAAKTNEEILNTWKIKVDDYKILIEQLKEEREREEKEKNRFFQLWELTEKSKSNLIIKTETEITGLKKELKTEQIKYTTEKVENEEKYKEIQNLIRAKGAMEREKTNFEETTKNQARTINNLTAEKQTLTQEKNQIQEQLTQKEQELTREIRKKRVGNLLAAGVFASDYLPLPKKWNSAIKGGFTAAQGWQIFADLPNATYEIVIGLVAVGVFFLVRKIKRKIFGRKEINLVNELRSELQEARSKVIMLKDEAREQKEKESKPAKSKPKEPAQESKNEKQENSPDKKLE